MRWAATATTRSSVTPPPTALPACAATTCIFGGDGADTLDGGAGADTLVGGIGDDTYVVDNASDAVTENSGEGTDTVRTTLSSFVLGANVENLVFTDGATHTGFGNALANIMAGGTGSDTLVAHTVAGLFAQEHDTLFGGDGSDTLYGEAADTLIGGAGFDVLQVINDFAMNLDLVATGIEYVVSGFGNDTYTAAAGTTAIEVYGGGGIDSITGGSGNDRLWAGVGNDTLVGNGGNDLLVGDLGADSLSGGAGNDRLYIDSSDTFIDGGADFDAAYIATGSGITINLATTNIEWVADFAGGNDTIDGSGMSVNLKVFAEGGTDNVTGGSGDDIFWGGSGNDTSDRQRRERHAGRRNGFGYADEATAAPTRCTRTVAAAATAYSTRSCSRTVGAPTSCSTSSTMSTSST